MSDRLPGIRPRQSLGRRLDAAARRAFPAVATALMLLVAACPLGLPGQAELEMAVALASVFFWSLFRPASMSPPAVFLLGLLADLLDMAPVGSGVLILLATHGAVLQLRRWLLQQSFHRVWLVFGAFALAAAAAAWALTALLTFRVLPVLPVLFQAALAIGFYPALATLFGRAHATLAEPDHA